jgi:hypothetical protein
MGGNAFKNGTTRRYEAAEYFDLVKRIKPRLLLISNQFEVIPAYDGKETFGDMDVLIVPRASQSGWTAQSLSNIFGSNGNVVHNGGVWSLVFEEMQIDLITTTDEGFDSALDYFSYNDYGNLRGKIVHKFGLKFGHDGLTLPVRSANHTLGTIVLSQDPVRTNKLFGFHPRKFETLEAMFEDVIGSYFFSPKVFAWDQMNAVARIRDKKRTTYHAFLKYIEGKTFIHEQEFHKDKSAYLSWIFHHFPEAKTEYDALWARMEMLEAAAAKFNGDLVREWTGASDKQLGDLMKELRRILPADDVLELSEENIKRIVFNVNEKMKEIK